MRGEEKCDGMEAGTSVSPAPTGNVTTSAGIDCRAWVGLVPVSGVLEGRSGRFRSGKEGKKKLQRLAGLGITAKEGVLGGVNMLCDIPMAYRYAKPGASWFETWIPGTVGSSAGQSLRSIVRDPSRRHINLLF